MSSSGALHPPSRGSFDHPETLPDDAALLEVLKVCLASQGPSNLEYTLKVYRKHSQQSTLSLQQQEAQVLCNLITRLEITSYPTIHSDELYLKLRPFIYVEYNHFEYYLWNLIRYEPHRVQEIDPDLEINPEVDIRQKNPYQGQYKFWSEREHKALLEGKFRPNPGNTHFRLTKKTVELLRDCVKDSRIYFFMLKDLFQELNLPKSLRDEDVDWYGAGSFRLYSRGRKTGLRGEWVYHLTRIDPKDLTVDEKLELAEMFYLFFFKNTRHLVRELAILDLQRGNSYEIFRELKVFLQDDGLFFKLREILFQDEAVQSSASTEIRDWILATFTANDAEVLFRPFIDRCVEWIFSRPEKPFMKVRKHLAIFIVDDYIKKRYNSTPTPGLFTVGNPSTVLAATESNIQCYQFSWTKIAEGCGEKLEGIAEFSGQPRNSMFYYAKGMFAFPRKRIDRRSYDEQINYFRKSVELDPDNELALYRLAKLSMKKGLRDGNFSNSSHSREAIYAARKFVEVAKQKLGCNTAEVGLLTKFIRFYGDMLLKARMKDQAIHCFQDAIFVNPRECMNHEGYLKCLDLKSFYHTLREWERITPGPIRPRFWNTGPVHWTNEHGEDIVRKSYMDCWSQNQQFWHTLYDIGFGNEANTAEYDLQHFRTRFLFASVESGDHDLLTDTYTKMKDYHCPSEFEVGLEDEDEDMDGLDDVRDRAGIHLAAFYAYITGNDLKAEECVQGIYLGDLKPDPPRTFHGVHNQLAYEATDLKVNIALRKIRKVPTGRNAEEEFSSIRGILESFYPPYDINSPKQSTFYREDFLRFRQLPEYMYCNLHAMVCRATGDIESSHLHANKALSGIFASFQDEYKRKSSAIGPKTTWFHLFMSLHLLGRHEDASVALWFLNDCCCTRILHKALGLVAWDMHTSKQYDGFQNLLHPLANSFKCSSCSLHPVPMVVSYPNSVKNIEDGYYISTAYFPGYARFQPGLLICVGCWESLCSGTLKHNVCGRKEDFVFRPPGKCKILDRDGNVDMGGRVVNLRTWFESLETEYGNLGNLLRDNIETLNNAAWESKEGRAIKEGKNLMPGFFD
ncbi:hypothetical protein TWF281_004409 [Arthrobotrys megalospora]